MTLRCPTCKTDVRPAGGRGGIAFWWCRACGRFSQVVRTLREPLES
jgi:hypothetical protein